MVDGIIHPMYPNGWLFPKNTYPKVLFTRSVKNFVRQAFFVSLIHVGNFLLFADNFYAQNFTLKKKKKRWRTKLFTLYKQGLRC